MQLNRWQRSALDPLGDNIVRAMEFMKLAFQLLTQEREFVEHIQHGGAVNERRRNKWVKVADVKRRYKGK